MFSLPDLQYGYDALEPHIDEQTMRIHHDKHHAGYVANLNKALEGHEDLLNKDLSKLMKNVTQLPEVIQTVVRNNGGGHANHSLFWSIMDKGKGGEPSGGIADAITQKFNSFSDFKETFSKAALTRFGSGWAWLVVDADGLSVTSTANQDTPLSEEKTPILGLDVWEHAYYLKYQNRRVDYISSWWNVVNWEEVQKRFEQTVS